MTEENKPEVLEAVILTEKQKEFIASCELEFSARYTSADVDFMNVKDNPSTEPPIVDPWYSKARRNYDWTDRRGQRSSHSDRDRDRDRGKNYRDYHQRHQNQRNYDHHRQGDRYYQRHRPY